MAAHHGFGQALGAILSCSRSGKLPETPDVLMQFPQHPIGAVASEIT